VCLLRFGLPINREENVVGICMDTSSNACIYIYIYRYTVYIIYKIYVIIIVLYYIIMPTGYIDIQYNTLIQ